MRTVLCQQCKKDFEITSKDRELLDILKVPDPTFCPRCRSVRRNVFRNERSLYKRGCDSCKKESIMMYSKETPFPVYCKPCWWSDSWNPKSFGREYDFSKPFFQQILELRNVVPRPGIIHQGNIINSEYTNRDTDMRNCYLVFGSTVSEDSRYSVCINGSKECQDCYATIKSEKCYETIDSTSCYDLSFSQECTNCRNSFFLQNCFNCSNCFGCVNLRNKQYCIFNEQLSKEEYAKKLLEFNLKSAQAVAELKVRFDKFKKQFVVPALVTRRSVASTGNWVEDCKNVTDSFNCQNMEDARHCYSVFSAKNVMDYSQWGNAAEHVYEAVNCGIQVANLHFAHECWNQIIDAQYVMNCHSSKNLFGCIGLRNSQYCILNKEYDKAPFDKLRARIIAQMNEMPYVDAGRRVYKYGEFFPIELSPHTYNETVSQEWYPISKEEAQKQKFPWREPESKNYKITMPSGNIPDSISDVNDDILKEIIGCAHSVSGQSDCNDQCTTAFKIIPEELRMYRLAGLPLPKLCPNCRHYARIRVRNPFLLWSRSCQRKGCHNTFETSYSPDRPEKVYCIECYQQEIS